MDYTQVQRVGIVGAGVAGLATARALLRQGIECTLFERHDVPGGVWSDGYLNFGVQVQKELYEFPDWPLPADTPDFTPGPVIQRYLVDFAQHFGIMPCIRFNASVTRVFEGADAGWTVTWSEAEESHEASFDLVVLCLGLYSSTPYVPDFPGRDTFDGEIIHNSSLKSPAQLTGRRVAVVGYGKSANDAVLEAAREAEEAHLVFRQPHWPIPQKLAGVLPFKWGLLHRLNIALIPPYQSASSLVTMLHTLGKPLVWFYWRLVEALIFFQCRLGSRFGTRVSLVPGEPIEIGAFSEATMVPKSDFFRLARRDQIHLHRTTVERFTPTGLELGDGSILAADLVILATGWHTDFSFLDERVIERLDMEDDGFYLYRHMLQPATPGLVFVGRAASISSILTYCLQAEWLARLIAGRHTLPSREAMTHNIVEMKGWKRSWMPASPSRSARLIAHSQNYHDELLRDMGVSPLRKAGWLAPLKELIVPYEPADYASLVDGGDG